jgi:hypothetical protein
MDGTPVAVVFFSSPVARPARDVPLILDTVVATVPTDVVTSPVRAGIRPAGRVPVDRSAALPEVATAARVGVPDT